MKNYLITLSILMAFILSTSNCGAKVLYNDDIQIKINRNHTHSRLSKEYDAYIFNINNISNFPISIQAISLEKSTSGTAASESVQRSSIAAGGKTILTGLAYAIPTLTLSLWGSIIAAPFQMLGNSFGNIGAKQEGNRYDVMPVMPLILNPNDFCEVKTLGVKHHEVKIRVLYTIDDNSALREISN